MMVKPMRVNNILIRAALIAASISFNSCSKNEITFFVPKNRVQIVTPEGQRQYYDVVFISNPPNDPKKIVEIIERYNNKTVKKDTIENNYSYFHRSFYRESSRTPKNFKDDEGFVPDYLYDHTYDLIANYTMKISQTENNTYIWSLSSDMGYLNFETRYY